jgi:hypothetical protein
VILKLERSHDGPTGFFDHMTNSAEPRNTQVQRAHAYEELEGSATLQIKGASPLVVQTAKVSLSSHKSAIIPFLHFNVDLLC